MILLRSNQVKVEKLAASGKPGLACLVYIGFVRNNLETVSKAIVEKYPCARGFPSTFTKFHRIQRESLIPEKREKIKMICPFQLSFESKLTELYELAVDFDA